MIAPDLIFDPVEHRYYLGSAELPGVTRVLDGLLTDFSMVNPDDLERARILGQDVHKATELDDGGILDEDDLAASLPRVVPYLRGWRKFVREMGFVPQLIEAKSYHPVFKFAGTVDRIGYLYGAIDGPPILIDIKRRDQLTPDVGPQTAAYMAIANAWRAKQGEAPIAKRACVRIFEDDYKFDWLADPGDLSTFMSCLNVFNYKRRHRRFFRELT